MRPCVLCPGICRSKCPVYSVFPLQQYSPHGIVRTLEIIGRSRRLRRHAGNVYACAMCYACKATCPVSFDVPAAVLEARRMVAPPARPKREVPKVLRNERAPRVLYLSSPYASADVRSSLTTILERAWGGVKVVEARGVYEAYAIADHEWFRECVETIRSLVKKVEVVICDSPELAHSLKGIVDVETHVRHLHRLLADGKVQLRARIGRVVIHDPCISSRVLDESEITRELLSLYGIEWSEPERSRAETFCCGGGGLLDVTHPRIFREIARIRADMLRRAGSPVLTTCQRCRRILCKAGVEALDLVEAIHP